MKAFLKRAWSVIRQRAKDIAARAGHTLWQAFLASLAITWAASGLDVSQVTDVDSAKRFVLAALGAVLAAGASAVKTTVSALLADAKTTVAASVAASPETPTA